MGSPRGSSSTNPCLWNSVWGPEQPGRVHLRGPAPWCLRRVRGSASGAQLPVKPVPWGEARNVPLYFGVFFPSCVTSY